MRRGRRAEWGREYICDEEHLAVEEGEHSADLAGDGQHHKEDADLYFSILVLLLSSMLKMLRKFIRLVLGYYNRTVKETERIGILT